MAEFYYPFESVNTGTASEPVYDRAITAEEERTFNKLRYTNGVFSSIGDGLSVSANGNMTVNVKSGGAHIEGALYYNTAPISLTIEDADASLNRIDRIVLQFNTSVSVRSVRPLVRTGTAATNPVAPELRQESNLWEIALADIYVAKGVTSISQSAITDQRLNSELCGFVVAAIPASVDTTGLFDQYQASLNEWLDVVAAALDETLAGNLQSQINICAKLSPKQAIPSGADLDEYRDAGTYVSESAEISASLENCPYTNGPFVLYVLKVGEYTRQVLEAMAEQTTYEQIIAGSGASTYGTGWLQTSGYDMEFYGSVQFYSETAFNDDIGLRDSTLETLWNSVF